MRRYWSMDSKSSVTNYEPRYKKRFRSRSKYSKDKSVTDANSVSSEVRPTSTKAPLEIEQ